MEGRKWEDLNKDIMVNVLGRVGMESLLLDVPFVCKSWYKASREPQCWEHLIFPSYFSPDDMWEEQSPDRGFAQRLVMKYGENLSITEFVKFTVNRSCGNATSIKLPGCCTEEALDYVANQCPRLKILDVGSHNVVNYVTIAKFISKWKNLEMLKLGKFYLEEILPQIGLHCKNFIWLSAPYNYFGKDEASVLVASLPELKYLDLHGGSFEKEALLMILQGCKQLVHLDVKNCFGFSDDDSEILELASHIPSFVCEGSMVVPDLESICLDDRRFDHMLFCDKINHDDCVVYGFDVNDLVEDI